METVECWQLALEAADRPTALVLSRQTLPSQRQNAETANACAYGAYILQDSDSDPHVTLFASGSEVSIAISAYKILKADGIPTRVVSVPSLDLFEAQSDSYRQALSAVSRVNIAVEAGVRLGWERVIGANGVFIGMNGFGVSGKGPELYAHFGITAEAIVEATRAALQMNA